LANFMRSATQPFRSFTESQPTQSLIRWSGILLISTQTLVEWI
jgi:hypothetical protein